MPRQSTSTIKGGIWPAVQLQRSLERRRRVGQRLFAAVLLLAAIPVIAAASLSIRTTRLGRVIFTQTRHGLHGRHFRIYKLRTMTDASRMETTIVGRLLRKTSIDELPQLWNVVRGEMALVGPRPHPIELDEAYEHAIDDLMSRYSVMPGITGLAQIEGARGPIMSANDMRRRVDLDLEYIRTSSLRVDLKILARTVLGGFLGGTR